MKWEYFGTGLAFAGIGLTLMLALPPPWWPKMPPSLVNIGLVIGLTLTIVGVILAVFGVWSLIPTPKIAVLGMAVAVVLFAAFAGWFWLAPGKSIVIADEEKKPLKRLIAYGNLDLIVAWNGSAPLFHGYNIRVNNVSDDTITAKIKFVRASVDMNLVMASHETDKVIIPQTQGSTFQFGVNIDSPIPVAASRYHSRFRS